MNQSPVRTRNELRYYKLKRITPKDDFLFATCFLIINPLDLSNRGFTRISQILRVSPFVVAQFIVRPNLIYPTLFHNSAQDMYAKDPSTIQSQNAFHTNVNLNTSSLTVFQHNHVLWDYSEYNLTSYNNDAHSESVNR